MQQLLEPQLVDLVDGDEQQLVVGRRPGLELLGGQKLLVLVVAFGPFVVLGVVVAVLRRRDVAADEAEQRGQP